MRRLIINADDLGLTCGVNRAILEAHQNGVVTSATLMANGREFEDAVRRVRPASRLTVGCHVVLADGVPLANASRIPSLIGNRDGGSAHFREQWSSFAWAALRRRLVGEEIEAEIIAQIRRLQGAGVVVSHLDTHKHTHLFPQVLRALLRAAQECGVRALRNPFGPIQWSLLLKRPSLSKRWFASAALQGWARGFRRTVNHAGLLTPDGTLGIVATGALDEQLFAGMVRQIPEGTWEFVCHPGYADVQLQSVRTRLRESRARELQLLTSTRARESLARERIELISYRDLS